MGIVIDVVILIIIALCVFLGYKKGLIGVAFKIITFVAAIVIAVLLVKPVSNQLIETTSWDEKIEQVIIENMSKEQTKEAIKGKENRSYAEIMINSMSNYIEDVADQAKNNAVEIVAEKFAITIINCIVFVLLFIIVTLICTLLKVVTDLLAKLPIIKQSNKIGGILYGLIKGIFIVYLILSLITLFAPIFNGFTLISYINQSNLGKFMYYNNLILKVLF